MGDCVELHPKPPFDREYCANPQCREMADLVGKGDDWAYHCTYCGCDFVVTGYEDSCLDDAITEITDYSPEE